MELKFKIEEPPAKSKNVAEWLKSLRLGTFISCNYVKEPTEKRLLYKINYAQYIVFMQDGSIDTCGAPDLTYENFSIVPADSTITLTINV